MTATTPAVASLAPCPQFIQPNARTLDRVGPIDTSSIEEVLARLPQLSVWPRSNQHGRIGERLRGARRILEWLESMPGGGWQQRWQAAGTDQEQRPWLDDLGAGELRSSSRREIVSGLACLLQARVMLPTYDFLLGMNAVRFFRDTRQVIQPELFTRAEAACAQRGMVGRQVSEVLTVLSKIVLHTAKDLDQLDVEDLLEFRAWNLARYSRHKSGLHGAWDVLRDLGILRADNTLRAALRVGQRPTAELVDHYRLQCRPIRDLLVSYLDERRPAMDFSSFRQLVSTLAGTFWADIERHAPGIDTLDLPAEVAEAWKQRLRMVTAKGVAGQERKGRLNILMRVRGFYLDIQEWAHEDASWAAWAVRSPVRRGETEGMAKNKRAATARVHQRIRERLPHLQVLVDAVDAHRADQAALLDTASVTPVGDTFEHADTTYRRSDYKCNSRTGTTQQGPDAVLVENLTTGETIELLRREEDAFWAWAMIDTLRHTGIRIEELLELTHLALVSYRLPDSGEVIPLLQIVPSKSNEERLLLVTPELASVLAAVISRNRGAEGRVPLAARYDPHERITGPLLPHLFQRKVGWRREIISERVVFRLLTEAMHLAGLKDRAGQPLRFTPHDFRRIFITDAVTGGLPVHIAARILGHHNLNTTQSYLAVFQDELIRSYRAYLDNRRALRPAAEYREPTEEEWTEFQKHFEYRKVELGTCGRPYGTPCQHEHACLRCPSLRPDPRQRPRLIEIIRNLNDRLTEARANGWLGEVQGLQTSLEAGKRKLASLDRIRDRQHTSPVNLGIPIITDQRQ